MSSSEATKGGSAKAPTGSKTAPSRKRKESSSAKDSNPSQPLVSKPVDTGMHKEDQQVAGGPTSLGVTSEEGARPQLSSGMSVFSKLKPIYLASVIIHSESASGYDASANSIAKADPRTSAPIDSLPLQQGKDEGTKNYSLDHIFAGTDPNVLADKTKSISDGLETVLATPKTGTKLMQNQDLDSPKDDPIIVVDDSEEDEEEDKNEEIHSTTNDKTEDISASIPPPQGPFRFKSSQINSLPTELKELPSKFNEITDEVKALKTQVHGHEIEVPWDLKELPTKLEEFTTIVTSLISQVAKLKSLQWELPAEFLLVPNPVASVQAKVKTLDALPCLLLKVTQALNMFAKVLHSVSKAGDQRVPLASQANTIPDFQDSPDDEEDTRSSHEYLNDLEEEYQARALLAKSKRFFKKVSTYQSPFQPKPFSSPQHKPELRLTKDFEAKYNKVKAKLALLSSSASASKASMVKNKGLIAEAYEWDEEEVSSDDNKMVEVKLLMALAEENDVVSKEGARNGVWVKIYMRKDELKELKAITKTWLNSSNKVNQCISEQIPSQKKRILKVDQLIEDPSSSGQKDLVFVKSSSDDTKVTIPSVKRPWLSKDEGFILPNHDTGRILLAKSQRNPIDPLVDVPDSSATIYDSADESSVCSTPLPPLKKLDSVEPISGPKIIKSILRSKSTFKAEAFKTCDIRKPIWYLDSGCSRHMTGVKSYLHKYMEQSGPKVVFRDNSTCTTKGYGLSNVMFDEKRGTIFNSNKEVLMIAPRISSPYTPEQNGVAERKNRTLIEATRTMLSGSIFSKQYWTEVVATACYTQNRSTNMKIHLKTPYEIFYHLGKFDEKANDGYLLRYSLISKAFRVFNTRRQQTKETYHITFDESPDDIKFLKPSVDDINIAEQKISKHLSSPSVEDTSVQNTTLVPTPPLPIASMSTLVPQDIWSQDKHIELVNIIGNPGAGMLTRSMAKQLSAASAHEFLFVDFLSEEEPKNVFEAPKHPGWVNAMQDELNQFAKNKVWTLVPAPYGKTIIGSK
ncbi:retrovirus-related pol polyprotein from transposon TNT 1-94 [Tanacetum coccineum]